MTLSQYLEEEIQKHGGKRATITEITGLHATEQARLLTLAPGKVPSPNILNKLSKLGLSVEELMSMCRTSKTMVQYNASGIQSGNCFELIDLSKELNQKDSSRQEVLTSLGIAETLCAQDKERYNPQKRFAGTKEQWEDIFRTYPSSSRIFYFIKDSNIEIVGDWSIALVEDGAALIDKKDCVIEEERIKLEQLPSMTIPKGEFDLVILNMALIDRYNEWQYIKPLVDSFEAAIQKFPKEMKIRNIYVNAYRRDYGFYRSLSFKQYDESKEPLEPNAAGENSPLLFVYDNGATENQNFAFKRGE